MFKKILIANRGEIAVRIIRACNEMGIRTVAVYSEIDKEALHTQMADESICIGPAKSKDSYLNMQNILSATVLTGAEAIHPGYGFLSENSKFTQMCEECNIKYIGPSSENIDNMGNKLKAREIMIKAGVPVVPGSVGAIETEADAIGWAEKIGYPVMIKASAGGGGRGIRVVTKLEDLVLAYNTARVESKTAFGDDTMYMEKFIEEPRHIEFQILADEFGNVIHLGERDCSVQRRNQKVIEEAPGPSMTQELRKHMGEVAVKAAQSINYRNAGTIEFLLDKYGKYYFMEMNTRIQVEHPITEMITGVDLLKAQIRIASGEELTYKQEDIKIQGHAIECRINAENPSKNFMPCPGVIKSIHLPGGFGVRIDSAAYQGYKIPHTYDSMIGKLIVHGKNRNEALCKMRRALGEFIVDGVDTNIDFQFKIINNENFVKGNFNTGFISKEFINI